MKKEYPEIHEYRFTEEDIKEIEKARKEKFGNWNWNYGKSPEYNITRSHKFEKGKIEIYANVIESKIDNIKIYGDFFGIEDVSAVEEVLKGTKYEREDVLKVLNSINLSRYFAGITPEEVAEVIVG